MASTRTLPPTTPIPSIPLSPSKKDLALKPNPHPYAIKTTSTALLTRSNTSEYNVNATRHYYVPLSPKSTRSDAGRGHRASKSLTAMSDSSTRESPRPLPNPPALEVPADRRMGHGSSGGYVSADETTSIPRQRPRRSETLPVIPLHTSGLLAPPPALEELPENPKLWTPSQLATYLTSALRVTSGGKPGEVESIGLPPLVAKDIAAFVKSARIGGRTFLRMNEEDLEALGMNKKWRHALLSALRNLRQNVLKGRIWGADGSPTSSPSPEFESPVQLFSNADLNSSSSSLSSSISGGEEEALDGAGAALGRSKARRYRNGRVRGMVETFERSGSFTSEGGLDDGDMGLPDRDRLRRWARQSEHVTGQSTLPDESPSPSRRRPLPVPPTMTGSSTGPLVHEEEPSMEALLANLGNANPVIGARAWEEMDFEPGVTVKRLPSNESDANISADRTLISSKSASDLGSGRGSGGSNKGKSERRVVTAIFAPINPTAAHAPVSADQPQNGISSSGDVPESTPPIEEPNGTLPERPLPPLPDLPGALGDPTKQEASLAVHNEPSELERLLEAEIAETRALLDNFRARLEVVEQKVAELEAKEAQREMESASASAASSRTRPELHASVEIGVQSESAVVDAEVQSDAVASPLHSSDSDPGSRHLANANVEVGNAPSGLENHLTTTSGLQGVIPDVVRRLQSSSSALFSSSAARTLGAVSRRDKDREDDDQTPSVSDLPSYVLLVGLGVCAVVLQVVLRKVVGRGAVAAWRP
ncbi:hypothetical protein BN946_scf185010.g30 [Trametes cinnabarina]|uniref:SAM domain-containing protein n=1 Tax=Pycnoporus cinnabarinus TaxID=5643 RepID=A0A060SL28_PYCCI|nr:hypothetical protein BN946_scf185010.g30 [Trametes cinnabarina]